MFSNQQQQQPQDFNIENPDHNLFINNPRSRNSFQAQGQPQQPQQSTSSPYHTMHHSNSFGPMAINPSSTVQGNHNSGQNNMAFTDPSSANWFGTSMDSNASSFGQSPVFGGRDLLVTPSNSTGHIIDSFNGGEDEELSQRNHQEIFEKRRRRRESHNAVERRRRDNINERIQELSTLLPEHLLESVPASSNVMSVATGQNGANGKPINKGTILKLSVDHIKELREEVTNCKGKIKDLERLIEIARGNQDPALQQHHLKAEDNGMDLYNQQQQQQQQHMHNLMAQQQQQQQQQQNAQRPSRHERVGSIQFQQQFGKLHITGEEQQQA
ncbi:helix-loop-helix DNA-binding domain-containing transcription factor [Mucor lusitanicus]|uniref:Helix-loop-helix DNA-binding domain-containing transcription factor n=2 Tax=Mucor circinelloides f. lusitanicus TaxID=29924 RepID=A0A168JFX9_MUCCL|nr:helix-loop-helix DNA-binding domain-containing transcription factor [Mucor lusitanicus]OAD01133.1 helix-loop-helix DNA-binding domain-containing transcription factor [Mucor lusitanicus CBS 277.49]